MMRCASRRKPLSDEADEGATEALGEREGEAEATGEGRAEAEAEGVGVA